MNSSTRKYSNQNQIGRALSAQKIINPCLNSYMLDIAQSTSRQALITTKPNIMILNVRNHSQTNRIHFQVTRTQALLLYEYQLASCNILRSLLFSIVAQVSLAHNIAASLA